MKEVLAATNEIKKSTLRSTKPKIKNKKTKPTRLSSICLSILCLITYIKSYIFDSSKKNLKTLLKSFR